MIDNVLEGDRLKSEHVDPGTLKSHPRSVIGPTANWCRALIHYCMTNVWACVGEKVWRYGRCKTYKAVSALVLVLRLPLMNLLLARCQQKSANKQRAGSWRPCARGQQQRCHPATSPATARHKPTLLLCYATWSCSKSRSWLRPTAEHKF